MLHRDGAAPRRVSLSKLCEVVCERDHFLAGVHDRVAGLGGVGVKPRGLVPTEFGRAIIGASQRVIDSAHELVEPARPDEPVVGGKCFQRTHIIGSK